MCEVSIYEAKTQLSKYIQMIQDGEEDKIVILKNGKRVACIVKEEPETEKRLGAGKAYCQFDSFVLKDDAYEIEDLFGYNE